MDINCIRHRKNMRLLLLAALLIFCISYILLVKRTFPKYTSKNDWFAIKRSMQYFLIIIFECNYIKFKNYFIINLKFIIYYLIFNKARIVYFCICNTRIYIYIYRWGVEKSTVRRWRHVHLSFHHLRLYVIATFLYGSMNKRALHYDGVSDLCLTSSNRCAYITA